ncbi:MAG: hypothetical protein HQL69_06500 [Magnetococcales bacterium]|nr:hypothetical protein [Magnetococcales bacterium]
MRNIKSDQNPPNRTCAFPFVEGTPCHPAPGRFSDKEIEAMGHVWDLSQQINKAKLQFNKLDGLLSAKLFQNKVGTQIARFKEERVVWQKRRRHATHAKH